MKVILTKLGAKQRKEEKEPEQQKTAGFDNLFLSNQETEYLSFSKSYDVVRCLTSKQERPRVEDSSQITLYWSLSVEGIA